MIFLKITGGLGNQMFQFATAYALAKKLNTKVGLDLSEINKKDGKTNFTYRNFQLEQVFNINHLEIIPSFSYNFIIGNHFLDKIKRFFIKGTFFYEKDLTFNPAVFDMQKNAYIEGYFQTEKYFIAYENDIRKQFSFKQKPNVKTENLSEIIKKENSIAIHVRRGDYVNNKTINSVHGACSLDYYKKALNHFDLTQHQLFFFSDDINWVKENFNFIDLSTSTFVDWNNGENAWQDMYLMSQCKHFIIANSSFSWWGAWLSINKDKKVIAPKQWFNNYLKNNQTKDLIPTSWIKV
jgi:hypothetical protein